VSRLYTLATAAGIVSVAGSLMLAKAQQRERPALIAGDRPVSVEQVTAKLKSDGCVILPNGRYLQVTGTRDGQARTLAVDAETGRLGPDDSKDISTTSSISSTPCRSLSPGASACGRKQTATCTLTTTR
jgi:hypothetical protein